MIQNEDIRTRFRLELLAQLEAFQPHGMNVTALHHGQREAGHMNTTLDDATIELSALIEGGLVRKEANAINAVASKFFLTEAGRVALRQAGY
jgi:DNA-binding MarR family transcriptional regulator